MMPMKYKQGALITGDGAATTSLSQLFFFPGSHPARNFAFYNRRCCRL